MSGGAEATGSERGGHVGGYFRLERWEILPPDGAETPSDFGGRAPVDDHQRGAGGGLRAGGLLTAIDSLGGFLCGLAVQPDWIVTTSIMATVTRLDHRGPLRLRGRLLRRGRTAAVAGLEIVDEGDGDAPVAVATMGCAVLDPGDLVLEFERPFRSPMPPLDPAAPGPEEFFCIEPGTGPVSRLELVERLRNPWGILHGGAVAMLADVAACRAVDVLGGGGMRSSGRRAAAAGAVLHYLRPARVGPVEARCEVLGVSADRAVVRVGIHDVGADDRQTVAGSVEVVLVPDAGEPVAVTTAAGTRPRRTQ